MSDEKWMYAAFIEDSYTVPGDERSRTHPGHGYPEHTVSCTKVREFQNEAEMREFVERQEKSNVYSKQYRIVKYVPLTVKTTVTVEVQCPLTPGRPKEKSR